MARRKGSGGRRRKSGAKRKRGARKRRPERKPGVAGLPAPSYAQFESPFDGMDDSARAEALRELADHGHERFDSSLDRLRRLLKTLDTRTLVSALCVNSLMIGVGEQGVRKSRANDHFGQSHVELLQALSLQMTEEQLGADPPTPASIQEVFDALSELALASSARRLDASLVGADSTRQGVARVQESLRTHTKFVRNWGYFKQVQGLLRDLYTCFDQDLEQARGFTVTDVLTIFARLVEVVEERATERLLFLHRLSRAGSAKTMIARYYEELGIEGEVEEFLALARARGARKKKQILVMLVSHYELRSSAIYTFDIPSLSAECHIPEGRVAGVVGEFSLGYGALANTPVEHLFLDNPVWRRPCVPLPNGRVFCPLPQVFFSFGMRSLDDLVAAVAPDRLRKRRADFLEEKLASTLAKGLPAAKVVRGLEWEVGGERYESDLVAGVDSVILIIEAKSHRISDAALRGAPSRLRRHVRETIVDPSIQSLRLENRIWELRENPTVVDELREALPIELSQVCHVIRVSVTLDNFAALQSSILTLQDAELLPEDFEPCPTMTLANFETVLDVLGDPVPILHYFTARKELEVSRRILGDELDYLGLYLQTHFDTPPGSDGDSLVISEMSAAIDLYYESRDSGVTLDKPRPRPSPLFESILRYVEQRARPRWTEFGMALSRFSPQRQLEAERHVRLLKRRVRRNRGRRTIDNIVVYSPPLGTELAIAFVAHSDDDSADRDSFMGDAADMGLAPEHVARCLVIAINVDEETPYSALALFKKPSGGDAGDPSH